MEKAPNFDYYAILDVPRTASASEIQQAFDKLIEQYRPDKASTEGEKAYYAQLSRNINEAYFYLSHEGRRERYDTLYLQPPGQLPNDPLAPNPLLLRLMERCTTPAEADKLEQELNSMKFDTKLGKDEYAFLRGIILMTNSAKVSLYEWEKQFAQVDKNWVLSLFNIKMVEGSEVLIKVYDILETSGLESIPKDKYLSKNHIFQKDSTKKTDNNPGTPRIKQTNDKGQTDSSAAQAQTQTQTQTQSQTQTNTQHHTNAQNDDDDDEEMTAGKIGCLVLIMFAVIFFLLMLAGVS